MSQTLLSTRRPNQLRAGDWGCFLSRLFTLHESHSEMQMKSRRHFLNPSFLHLLHYTILCTAVSFMERRRHILLNRLDVTHRDRIFLQLFQLCHILTRCYWCLSVLITFLGAFDAEERRYRNGTAINVKSLKFGSFHLEQSQQTLQTSLWIYSVTIVVKSCCEVKTRYLMRSLRQRVRWKKIVSCIMGNLWSVSFVQYYVKTVDTLI